MRSAEWQRRLKWAVYALLLVDYVIYAYQDWESAPYTLGEHPTLLHWMRAYVTTIDLTAWFTLILFFELETGGWAARMQEAVAKHVVRGVRLLCYVAILHTTFSDLDVLHQMQTPSRLPAAANLCAYADGSWSFLENRGYTTIDEENCKTIARDSEFFAFDSEFVVTDRAGVTEAVTLAWTDVVENLAWLMIIFANEIVARMQSRGVVSGVGITFFNRLKVPMYALILGIACYWLSKDQILYFWDDVLWVCGFFMIETNLRMHRRRVLGATRRAGSAFNRLLFRSPP